jgi:site-specific DNA recombinase
MKAWILRPVAADSPPTSRLSSPPDYIRNLREETKKGFYGRIKQGLYPLPAPLGYLDRGKGKPKELDPARAPLVRRMFTTYSTGRLNLYELSDEMYRLGLRNRNGHRLSLNGISVMLKNPFYMGLIRLRRTGKTFPGIHEPLISKSLFDRVQLVLKGKFAARSQTHDFAFRRMVKCGLCGYSLIGECQKGHVYYRCHIQDCPTKSVREEVVDEAIRDAFEPLRFAEDEKQILLEVFEEVRGDLLRQWDAETNALRLRKSQIRERMDRLTDAYLDQVIDKESFESRKSSLLMEEKALEENLGQPKQAIAERLSKFLELAMNAPVLYETAIPEEKRELLHVEPDLCRQKDSSHAESAVPGGGESAFTYKRCPSQGRHRTSRALILRLTAYFAANPLKAITRQFLNRSPD